MQNACCPCCPQQQKFNRRRLDSWTKKIVIEAKQLNVPREDILKFVWDKMRAEISNHKGSLKHLLELSVYHPVPSDDPKGYQKYVVMNYPGDEDYGKFSFTLIVLSQHQQTPIHDHKVICAPICIQGIMTEVLYRVNEGDARGTTLQEVKRHEMHPGNGNFLYPEGLNCHTVGNYSFDGVSMSLHLYAFDAEEVTADGKLVSSVKRVYDKSQVLLADAAVSTTTLEDASDDGDCVSAAAA
eukprot:TRINITY_DN65229_c0_g2_i2.p1 TRINITY_DN65229_c0_g2~~TRINITY_DN65229_c0_g2_i2.p1  ORF type:complete len:240 (-),score=51.69 TRINITY_DN65229_c0_g2_i2:76-795(-)